MPGAKARGITYAALLMEALDERDRRLRREAVGETFALLSPDDDDWDELRHWDALLSDGLPNA